MPRKCAALYCGNRYIPNENNISYFKFPQDKNEFFAWADLCHRPDLKSYYKEKCRPRLVLCQKHFQECDYYQCGQRNYLNRGALPTLEIDDTSSPAKKDSSLKIAPFIICEDKSKNDSLQIESVEISDNTHVTDLDEDLLCLEHLDSPEMFETATINITKNEMPAVLFSSEEIPSSKSFFNGSSTSITFQSSNQISNKNSSSKDIPGSCNSETSICSHHISYVEEKARTYKLEKEVSQLRECVNILTEETRLQRVEISLLTEKIKILENIKQEVSDINSNTEEMIVDNRNVFKYSEEPFREIKVECIEKVEEEF